METVATPPEEAGLKIQKRKLKSGLVFGLDALNQLTTRISSHPSLTAEEIQALNSRDFEDRFQQAAETGVRFRGTASEAVSLWVFPTVKLQKIVLKRVSRGNQFNQVEEMSDHPVYFPIPVMAQFVGLSTEN